MNPRRYIFLVLIGSACGLPFSAAKTRTRPPPESDLASIDTRRVAVELAVKLAKVEEPAALANNSLPRPFNPAGFGMTARPAEAAAASGPPSRAFGDHEILAALASRVLPKGTLGQGSNQLLSFGKKNLRVGDQLTVNYEGQDYTLELVAFDRTNFTLRLNHEEITRPIKPGKNP
jgi:hypothetical protein